jgi:adenylate cyclase
VRTFRRAHERTTRVLGLRASMNGIQAIADWLIDGARSAASAETFVAEFCDRLRSCGFPIWRVGVFVHTLHPQIMGQRFLWRPDQPVEVTYGSYETFQNEEFRRSPVRYAIDNRVSLRRKLADENCPLDFAFVHELRAQGITDYFVVPLFFADGTIHATSMLTRESGGFTDQQIAALSQLSAPLARVTEAHALQRKASILLDTYVGPHAAARVLAGQIRRGDATSINAAIWLSDMRGFTQMADLLPPQTLVDALNRYFDCQVPAILKHGGEVLKYMGDGLLAIFAISEDGSNKQAVCDAALAAAREARFAVAAASTVADGNFDLKFGLALHLGEVLYGNIGSENRLDFTCIGPAVNLAARIEKLTGELGRTVLASDAFADHFEDEFVPVGKFALRGFGTARTVFGLKDEARE